MTPSRIGSSLGRGNVPVALSPQSDPMVAELHPGSGQVRTASISDVDMNYSERPRCRSAELALIIGRLMVKENLHENRVLDEASALAR